MKRFPRPIFGILLLCLAAHFASCKKRVSTDSQQSKPSSDNPTGVKTESVPPHILDLVFKRSDFAAPITLGLQFQDGRKFYEELRAKPLPPDHVVAPGLGGWSNTPASVVWLLTKTNTARVEEVVHNYPSVTKRYKFLFYNESLKPFVVEARSMQSPFDGNAMFGGGFKIGIATRKLKSIDYTNAYEDAGRFGGAKIKVYALTFSYTVESTFPSIPNVTNIFTGKAKAYLDPDDGTWKLEHCSLNDRGTAIFTDWLEEQSRSERIAELSAAAKAAAVRQQWAEVVLNARDLLAIRPDDLEIKALLAKAAVMETLDKARKSMKDGNWRQALYLCDEAKTTAPDNQEATLLRNEIQLGFSIARSQESMQKGEFDAAYEAIEEALAIKPDSSQAVSVKQRIIGAISSDPRYFGKHFKVVAEIRNTAAVKGRIIALSYSNDGKHLLGRQ